MQPTPYIFRGGFVQSRHIARVLTQIDEMIEQVDASTDVFKWQAASGAWTSFELEWAAHRIAVRDLADDFELFVMGPQGWVLCALPAGDNIEEIDATDGVRRSGDFLDLQVIGSHLYACGMSRQVYRRQSDNNWVRADQGVVQPAGTLEIAGFTSMHGLHDTDFYAVGFAGEVWRCLVGTWQQISSPTNVVLHCVRVVEPSSIYACGQRGVILRGDGVRFHAIDAGDMRDELWSLQSFKGSIYFASENAIYRLLPNDSLEAVDTGLEDGVSYRHLHANDGVMWSFGSKHIAWTDDAKTWHDVTP